MSILLDPTERRVLGSLVEKELSVPESYPMTLNAVVLACNQKSNRDPEMSLPEHDVLGALHALRDRGWVNDVELAGARTIRYGHRASEQLAVDQRDLAILAELWLRGPQSPIELKTRASRMRPFSSPEEVEGRLRALAARPVPYVRFLGKRPGERVPRWEHAFAHEGERAGTTAPEAPSAGAPLPAEAPARPADALSPLAALEARVARLEAEVASLRTRLGDAPAT
jgi:uncharacterized protein YceH (UPF0502 family)